MAPSTRSARLKRKPVTSSNKKMNEGKSTCGDLYASSCSQQVVDDIHVQADDHQPEEEENSSVDCCTPKAHKFRIPEVLSCPPAPKKRRVLRNHVSKSNRSPIACLPHPDIELFFLFAVKDVA